MNCDRKSGDGEFYECRAMPDGVVVSIVVCEACKRAEWVGGKPPEKLHGALEVFRKATERELATLEPSRYRVLVGLAMSFLWAMREWAAVRFRVSHNAAKRADVCRACSHRGALICRACGCLLWLKVRVPAASCPVGKWFADDRPNPAKPTLPIVQAGGDPCGCKR